MFEILFEKITQLILIFLRALGIDKYLLPQKFSHHDLCHHLKYLYKDIGMNSAMNYGHVINRYLPKHSIQPEIIFSGTIISLFLGIYLLWNFYNKFVKYSKAKNLPKDVALVYGTPAGTTVPNVSPYVLKLETYLRMANIPYKTDTNFIRSKEGKVPWVLYNGLEIADSQRCIEFFNKKLTINFDHHLTEREKATAHAFRILVDHHLIWSLIMIRFMYGGIGNFLSMIHCHPVKRVIYTLLWPYYYCMFAKKARKNGIGYRTRSEVYEIAFKDMAALSTFLGNKSFFMGEQFSEIDAAIFGFLAQLVWTLPEDNPLRKKLQSEWTNLASYCVRMKKRFWPDWDKRISTGLL